MRARARLACIAAVLLLAVLLAVAAGGAPVVALVVIPLLVSFLGWEVMENGGAVGCEVVRMAVLLLPKHERKEHRDLWIDHVLEAGDRGLAPVASALSIAAVGAPVIAAVTRYGHDAGQRRTDAALRRDALNRELFGVIFALAMTDFEPVDGRPFDVAFEELAIRKERSDDSSRFCREWTELLLAIGRGKADLDDYRHWVKRELDGGR